MPSQVVTIGYLKTFVSGILDVNSAYTDNTYCPTYNELTGGGIVTNYKADTNPTKTTNGIRINGCSVNTGYENNQLVVVDDLELLYQQLQSIDVSASNTSISCCSGSTTLSTTASFKLITKTNEGTTTGSTTTATVTASYSDNASYTTISGSKITFSKNSVNTSNCTGAAARTATVTGSYTYSSTTKTDTVDITQNKNSIDTNWTNTSTSTNSISVSPSSMSFSSAGGTKSFTVTRYYTQYREKYDECDVAVCWDNYDTSSTVTPTNASVTGDFSCTKSSVSAEVNSGSDRSGTLTVTYGGYSDTCSISQGASQAGTINGEPYDYDYYLSVYTPSGKISCDGGSANFTATFVTTWKYDWETRNDAGEVTNSGTSNSSDSEDVTNSTEWSTTVGSVNSSGKLTLGSYDSDTRRKATVTGTYGIYSDSDYVYQENCKPSSPCDCDTQTTITATASFGVGASSYNSSINMYEATVSGTVTLSEVITCGEAYFSIYFGIGPYDNAASIDITIPNGKKTASYSYKATSSIDDFQVYGDDYRSYSLTFDDTDCYKAGNVNITCNGWSGSGGGGGSSCMNIEYTVNGNVNCTVYFKTTNGTQQATHTVNSSGTQQLCNVAIGTELVVSCSDTAVTISGDEQFTYTDDSTAYITLTQTGGGGTTDPECNTPNGSYANANDFRIDFSQAVASNVTVTVKLKDHNCNTVETVDIDVSSGKKTGYGYDCHELETTTGAYFEITNVSPSSDSKYIYWGGDCDYDDSGNCSEPSCTPTTSYTYSNYNVTYTGGAVACDKQATPTVTATKTTTIKKADCTESSTNQNNVTISSSDFTVTYNPTGNNTTNSNRTVTGTVKHANNTAGTFTFTQNSGSTCYIAPIDDYQFTDVTPDSTNMTIASGGGSVNLVIYSTKNGSLYNSITVSEDCDWITVGSPTLVNSQYYQFTVTATKNETTSARNCKIILTQTTSNKQLEFTVSQTKGSAPVSTYVMQLTSSNNNSSATFNGSVHHSTATYGYIYCYSTKDGSNQNVTATSDKTWLTVEANNDLPYAGASHNFKFTCSENTSTSSRTGTITLKQSESNKTVTWTVTQAGKSCTEETKWTGFSVSVSDIGACDTTYIPIVKLVGIKTKTNCTTENVTGDTISELGNYTKSISPSISKNKTSSVKTYTVTISGRGSYSGFTGSATFKQAANCVESIPYTYTFKNCYSDRQLAVFASNVTPSGSHNNYAMLSAIDGLSVPIIVDSVSGTPANGGNVGIGGTLKVYSVTTTSSSWKLEESITLTAENRSFEYGCVSCNCNGVSISLSKSNDVLVNNDAYTTVTVKSSDGTCDTTWTASNGTTGKTGDVFRVSSTGTYSVKATACTGKSATFTVNEASIVKSITITNNFTETISYAGGEGTSQSKWNGTLACGNSYTFNVTNQDSRHQIYLSDCGYANQQSWGGGGITISIDGDNIEFSTIIQDGSVTVGNKTDSSVTLIPTMSGQNQFNGMIDIEHGRYLFEITFQ